MVELNVLIGTINSLIAAYGPFMLVFGIFVVTVFVIVVGLLLGLVVTGFMDHYKFGRDMRNDRYRS